jgi:hypothetical protein
MLSVTPEQTSIISLDCQIVVNDEMDNITEHLPEFQM